MTTPTMGDTVRFISKLHLTDGCWEWGGYRRKNGYGRVWCGGRMWLTHRLSFLIANGRCGPEIDHICRNRACVRPSHLREVTSRENVLAPGSVAIPKLNSEKTACPQGHPYEPGKRGRCLECQRQRQRTERYRIRERERKGRPTVRILNGEEP
jgi:hypothetical protein